MKTLPHPVLLVLAFMLALTAWEIFSGSTNIWVIHRYFRHDVYRNENPVAFWSLIVVRLALFVWLSFALGL